jgi:Outer membrane lipoprotein carrier protein LolA-like
MPLRNLSCAPGPQAPARRSLCGWLLSGAVAAVVPAARAQTYATLPAQAAEELLARVCAAVARQPLAAVPFYERRMSALLATPLESRGTLAYDTAGNLEKLTTTPIRESLALSSDAITMRSGDAAPQTIRFEARPEIAGYVRGLRAVLAGDHKALRRHFDARIGGSFNRWELKLSPLDEAVKRAIRQIVVSGEKGLVRVIETSAVGGDVNELTLIQK